MLINDLFYLKEYETNDKDKLFIFLEKCLLETGRHFEPEGIHKNLQHVKDTFDYFLCLYEKESGAIIGTSAFRRLDAEKCELKCVYLFEKYHGMGLGTSMCKKVLEVAKSMGYMEIYLDTISKTSGKAINMYQRLGFKETEKYHETVRSDVFMKLIL